MFLAIFLFLGRNIFFRRCCCSLRKPTVVFRCVTNRPILRRHTVSVREVGAGGLQRAGCRRDGAVRSDGFGCGPERSCRKEAGTSGRAIRDCFRAVKSRRLPVGRMGCAGRWWIGRVFFEEPHVLGCLPGSAFRRGSCHRPALSGLFRALIGLWPPFRPARQPAVFVVGRLGLLSREVRSSNPGIFVRRNVGTEKFRLCGVERVDGRMRGDRCAVLRGVLREVCASVARMIPHGVSHGCCCAEYVHATSQGTSGKQKTAR